MAGVIANRRQFGQRRSTRGLLETATLRSWRGHHSQVNLGSSRHRGKISLKAQFSARQFLREHASVAQPGSDGRVPSGI